VRWCCRVFALFTMKKRSFHVFAVKDKERKKCFENTDLLACIEYAYAYGKKWYICHTDATSIELRSHDNTLLFIITYQDT
jgi:hypothetical protein